METQTTPSWLKNRGYLHITPQIDVSNRQNEILAKLKNADYVASYSFFPLIHTSIKERRFKPHPVESYRCHSYQKKDGKFKKQEKIRPLHYSTHRDALVFGYYAEIIQSFYEKYLSTKQNLSECILAYRKIPIKIGDAKNKGTIHFARELFDEIKERSKNEECVVLTYDIENFFSNLDHRKLKKAWIDILGETTLPKDHYNVFKATTRFSYILLNDLRIKKNRYNNGFNEKKLAEIRNRLGINSFFESAKEFREYLLSGKLKIYRFPFRNKKKEIVGIPQGLPISAVLANIYLLEFDKVICERVVDELGATYRRYSDDIIFICNAQNSDKIDSIVKKAIEDRNLSISKDKSEKFLFIKKSFGNKSPRLTSVKILENICKMEVPVTYLGFSFYGHKTLIKSSNLAKFYRKMIFSIKRKAKLASKLSDSNNSKKPILFKQQLFRLYVNSNLNNKKTRSRVTFLIKNRLGEFRIVSKLKKTTKGNYFNYIDRASLIMDDKSITTQLRNHRKIFNQAIQRHSRTVKADF